MGMLHIMPERVRRPTQRAQKLRNNATPAERMLWDHLSRRQLNGWKFSRQMPVGPFVCDFLSRELKLVVELDGGQHHDNRADAARTAYIEQQGFRVVRYWNNEVQENVAGVLEHLRALIGQPHPQPLPHAGGGD